MPSRPFCEEIFCASISAEMDDFCKENAWPVNHPLVMLDPQGRPCLCLCSGGYGASAFGAPVLDSGGSFKEIESFVAGEDVMAAGVTLEWAPRPVVFSRGTTRVFRQMNVVLVQYENKEMSVIGDHLFLVAGHGNDRILKRADRLTAEDRLISPIGEPVEITGLYTGQLLSRFHHVGATSRVPVGDNLHDLDGHLLNTNGVVSADYIVTLSVRNGGVAGFSV